MALVQAKYIVPLILLIATFLAGVVSYPTARSVRNILKDHSPVWDSTKSVPWPERFEKVEIPSSYDGAIQKAWIFRAQSVAPKALIVSLHTWGGDYSQYDPLAAMAEEADINYIHPDFRGANRRPESCASVEALRDIDDAITWAKEHLNVSEEGIYVVGTSGGGHAACASYLNTRHRVRAFHAWVPITDIEAWYYQGRQRGNRYPQDILQIVGAEEIETEEAGKRSPLYMELKESPDSKIYLYAGIRDGYEGSVPVSHSLLFWNRLCEHYGYPEEKVSETEIVSVLTRGVPPKAEEIQGRSVYIHKKNDLGELVIFEGGHEMLPEYSIQRILDDYSKK